MNHALVGRTYGPYRYEVGAEKIREFALAIGGGVPSPIYDQPFPADVPREYWDDAYARERHGGPLVAPPTFCVTFAIKPFIASMFDEAFAVDRLRLVHGEQAFDFLAPVRAGDVLVTTGSIVSTEAKEHLDVATVETVSVNQHGREVVRGTWTAVVRK
jgi:hypothetical protein